MNCRWTIFFLCLVAVTGAAFAADLPDAWRAWRFSRPIPLETPSGLIEVELPRDLLAHSANHLADLRLLDDRGKEVPYVLYVDRGGDPVIRSSTAKLRENSFVPGQFTQVVLEVQTDALFHNTVRIDTPESDFINWVEVAASDDARLWRIVKARAPISRFRKENLEGSQTIHYSENASRFLRLRIFESARQFPVTGAAILTYDTRQPARLPVPVPAAFQLDSSAPANLTRWSADLSTDQLPVTQLVFSTIQPEFYRAVRILTSADGKEWRTICGGEIFRYKVGEKLEESLRVSFPENWGGRYWRVEILNGNDAPLTETTLSLNMIPRFVFFQPAEGRSYRMIYGNAAAVAPQYDLSRIFHFQGKPSGSIVIAGPEEGTSNYADPRPYTERHPNILWSALGVAVILLAYAAFRALRTPAEQQQ
jgi:hypothetical protein